MNIIITVLEIVAPVFLLTAVGFVWVKLGYEYRIQFVTRLAMTVSVPCLIFVTLMQAQMDPSAIVNLSFATMAAYGAVTVVFWALVWVFGLNRRTYLAPMIFGNTGNLGLPLAIFAFGDAGLSNAIVVFAIMAVMSFTFGIWLVSGSTSPTKVLGEPLVAATILGAIFLWRGWETPEFLTNTLSLIGQIAVPVMLITLGVAVARLNPQGIWRATVLSFVKVTVCTAIAWGVATVFKLDPIGFAVLVVQVATPVAVTSYLLAEKYGADAQAVAGLVVVSTLMSVGALPLILAFVL